MSQRIRVRALVRLSAHVGRRQGRIMAKQDNLLLDKYRGCMLGGLLGDTLGAPLEFVTDGRISAERVLKQFDKYEKWNGESDDLMQYTDDTAMARQLAKSVSTQGCLDQRDLARRFTLEYFRNPYRGYGRGVVDIFEKLREQEDFSDCLGPSKAQFGGSGSYGNGGAMRVHPVALFCGPEATRDILEETAKDSAMVTHAHKDGFNGAILQAYAVHLALRDTGNAEFLQKLKDQAMLFGESDEDSFVNGLKLMERFLAEKDDVNALKHLGNDVTALKSVPSAIYSFLRVREGPVEAALQKTDNLFERTLQFAYLFGGDTDTIGSMAGAIAGAAYGAKLIPPYLVRQCEASEEVRKLGEELHKVSMCEDARAAKRSRTDVL